MGEKRCLQSTGGKSEGRRPLGGISLLYKELSVSKKMNLYDGSGWLVGWVGMRYLISIFSFTGLVIVWVRLKTISPHIVLKNIQGLS